MPPSNDSGKLVSSDTQVTREPSATSSNRGCSEGCRCERGRQAGAAGGGGGDGRSKVMVTLYPTGFLHELGPLLKLATPIVRVLILFITYYLYCYLYLVLFGNLLIRRNIIL